MLAHLIVYYNKYGRGAERREAAIQREIEQYRQRITAYEKPKNDRDVRLGLSDDGEIEAFDEDEDSRAEKRFRR